MVTTQITRLDWLMAGDPAIRWQTQRDLLHRPAKEWRAEQQRTLTEGWGARLLVLQAPDGSWGGGIYAPKWTSTTYTLLILCDIGIPRESEAGRRGWRSHHMSTTPATFASARRRRRLLCERPAASRLCPANRLRSAFQI